MQMNVLYRREGNNVLVVVLANDAEAVDSWTTRFIDYKVGHGAHLFRETKESSVEGGENIKLNRCPTVYNQIN